MAINIADSYFIDPDTGKKIEVQMRYTNSGDSTMQTPKNYFRMKNGKVEKQREGGLWVEPNTEDPYYWLNNFKQAVQNQQKPENAFKYFWKKLIKNKQGGTMNYAQYLQTGGNLAQPEIEEKLGEQQVKALVQAIIENGDEQAADTLVEQLKLDPENGWIMDWIAGAKEAAEAGDEKAQKFWNLIGPRLEALQQTEQFKCGGRVRAKVKKASCGKKLENGAKVPVEKKGGCPCQYRRVGGRIQLVDCNGIPVAKDGTVLYARSGNELPPAQASATVTNYMTAKPIINAVPFSDQWFGDLGKAFVNRTNRWQNNLQQNNPSFWGTPTTVKKVTTVETSQAPIGSEEWKAQQKANQEAYYKTLEGQEAIKKADAAVKARQDAVKPSDQTTSVVRSRGYFADNGFANLQSFAARKAWLQDQANADYVKALGFDVNSYKGTAAQNKALLGMLQSKQMLDRDQQEQAAEFAAMKAQNANLSRLTPIQRGFATTVITPDVMQARSPLNLSLKKNVVFSKSGGKFPYIDYLK